ncbi:MAG: hypothetical protein U1C74_03295 [Phenylobacterium sp.]|nr:hypothetical protein [Phenylobacterium sp.]
MTRYIRLSLAFVACLGVGAAVAQTPPPATCEVKLASEMERADAQTYLIRLELAAAKRQLAAALAKCGDACAAKTP